METWSSYVDGLGREGCAADPAALLRPGLELELVRQSANMSRPFAVAICRHGTLIGYLPKPDARPIAKLLDQGGTARAFVAEVRQRRSFRGRRLDAIRIDIELSPPAGETWNGAEFTDAPEGSEQPSSRRRRSKLVFYGRTGAALCVGIVALIVWAGLPDTDDDEEPTPRALAIAARAAAPPAKPAGKTQERPATAPVAVVPSGPAVQPPAAPEPVPAPILSTAPPAADSGVTTVGSEPGNMQAAGQEEALQPETVAATPETGTEPPGTGALKVAQAAPLVEAVPIPIAAPRRVSVPLPLPRPAIPKSRSRKR
ncbi:HIRAN domain-containing protein [Ancylobacter terrae]|uniref:HIRAN domain-containing protein n=1 Tax=Ancylobacter sp. sgz301288 TaxID=3342077 RepID=UPI00386AFA8D